MLGIIPFFLILIQFLSQCYEKVTFPVILYHCHMITAFLDFWCFHETFLSIKPCLLPFQVSLHDPEMEGNIDLSSQFCLFSVVMPVHIQSSSNSCFIFFFVCLPLDHHLKLESVHVLTFSFTLLFCKSISFFSELFFEKFRFSLKWLKVWILLCYSLFQLPHFVFQFFLNCIMIFIVYQVRTVCVMLPVYFERFALFF